MSAAKSRKIKSKNRKETDKSKYIPTDEWLSITSEIRKRNMSKAQKNFIIIAKSNGIIMKPEIPVRIDDKIYIIDLRVGDYNIAIEVDGLYHETLLQRKRDQVRTQNLHKAHYNVFRISNADALDYKICNEYIQDIKKIIDGLEQTRFKVKIPIQKIS